MVISLNNERIKREGLKGLQLSALDAFLDSINSHLKKDAAAGESFNTAISRVLESRSGNPVHIAITSSLDPDSKTLRYSFTVN